MTIQTKPASRRLTPIIAVAGSGRSPVTHVVYVTQARATELFCLGVLTLIEVNGRMEYLLAQGATRRAR